MTDHPELALDRLDSFRWDAMAVGRGWKPRPLRGSCEGADVILDARGCAEEEQHRPGGSLPEAHRPPVSSPVSFIRARVLRNQSGSLPVSTTRPRTGSTSPMGYYGVGMRRADADPDQPLLAGHHLPAQLWRAADEVAGMNNHSTHRDLFHFATPAGQHSLKRQPVI